MRRISNDRRLVFFDGQVELTPSYAFTSCEQLCTHDFCFPFTRLHYDGDALLSRHNPRWRASTKSDQFVLPFRSFLVFVKNRAFVPIRTAFFYSLK